MIQKFVGGELNAQEFWDRLLVDQEKAHNLLEDSQKQANIEVNPNVFQFSKIILSFQFYYLQVDYLQLYDYFS